MSSRKRIISQTGRRVLLLAPALASLVASTGCGNKYGATANGYVTLDGEPVRDGRLTFARPGSNDIPAIGAIGDDGGYSLTTNAEAGVVPGEYRVSVQSFKPIEGLEPGERSFETPEPMVPRRYLNVKTSGLTYTVEPGSNRIDIKLTTDASAG